MIPRSTRPEMAAIWDAQTRFRIWFEIEAHATDALAERGIVPKEAARRSGPRVRRDLRYRPHRRDRARGQARRHRVPHPPRRDRRAGGALRPPGHDVVGRARHLPQRPTGARRRPADRRCRQGAGRAQRRAFEYKTTPVVGRSHGIHAEPTTFGLKLAYAYAEFAPRPRAAGGGPPRGRDLRDLGRGRDLRPGRPGG